VDYSKFSIASIVLCIAALSVNGMSQNRLKMDLQATESSPLQEQRIRNKPTYVIVVPDRDSPIISFAASELSRVLQLRDARVDLRKGVNTFERKTEAQLTRDIFLLAVSDVLPSLPRPIAADSLKPQEYSISIPTGNDAACVVGGDDRAVLYGTMDLIHEHVKELLNGEAVEVRDKPRIAIRGIWTWGGRIYNYERFIDNMARWKFNSLILWHRFPPANAKELVQYAHARGIELIWGYTWGWGLPVCPSDPIELAQWKDHVLKTYSEIYANTGGDGVYFQTFTEVGSKTQFCRFGSKCPNGCLLKSAGELLADWVNPIVEAFTREFPGVKIYCGVHAGAFRNELRDVAKVDQRAVVMWEDAGSFPFAYHPWSVDENSFRETAQFVGQLARSQRQEANSANTALTGATAFVFKGMVAGWGGLAPMHIEDEALLQRLAEQRATFWQPYERSWRENAPYEFQMVRIIENAPVAEKAIYGLIEDALFEMRQWLPVVLFAESLWNPHRDARELIQKLEGVSEVTSVAK